MGGSEGEGSFKLEVIGASSRLAVLGESFGSSGNSGSTLLRSSPTRRRDGVEYFRWHFCRGTYVRMTLEYYSILSYTLVSTHYML